MMKGRLICLSSSKLFVGINSIHFLAKDRMLLRLSISKEEEKLYIFSCIENGFQKIGDHFFHSTKFGSIDPINHRRRRSCNCICYRKTGSCCRRRRLFLMIKRKKIINFYNFCSISFLMCEHVEKG